jgi:hypothetical protein
MILLHCQIVFTKTVREKSKDSEVLQFEIGRQQKVCLSLIAKMSKFVILSHADIDGVGKSRTCRCFHPLPSSLGRFCSIVKLLVGKNTSGKIEGQ